jgi:putative GTP pyrophosphokinase
MSYLPRDLQRAAKNISAEIEDILIQSGMFYRIFYRCKTSDSLISKLSLLSESGDFKYDGEKKTLRDVIGIRINLYFVDDLEIITNHIKEKFTDSFKEETIDLKQTTEFKPTRVNLIFALPAHLAKEFNDVIPDSRVEATYELQIRTVFSEGWHEVEHDLRYKCANDWVEHNDLARTFNGILASLETQEWAMLKIMDELSYKHYKVKNLSALVRTKLRIRTTDYIVSQDVQDCIDDNFIRIIFKLDRSSVMKFLLRSSIRIPFKLDNLIWLINYFFVKNDFLLGKTPQHLIEEFKMEHQKPDPLDFQFD